MSRNEEERRGEMGQRSNVRKKDKDSQYVVKKKKKKIAKGSESATPFFEKIIPVPGKCWLVHFLSTTGKALGKIDS
jgi:hypothetical protein